MNSKRTGIAKLMRRRIFLVVNLSLLFLVGWGFAGEFMRDASVQEEIDRLQAQVEKFEGRNLELGRLAERYSGSAMLEREARLKLNLKKPGEEVVVVRDTNPATLAVEETRGREATSDLLTSTEFGQSSNIQKWISHFFPNLFDK